MKKVLIDDSPLHTGHAVRGVGMHTKNLLRKVYSIKSPELKVDIKTYQPNDIYKYDLVHLPYFSLFFKNHFSQKMRQKRAKILVTIHDVIPLIYPNYYPRGLKGSIQFSKNKFYLQKNVDWVITISETSKKDIVRFLDYPEERISVSLLAPNFEFKKISKSEAFKIAKKHGINSKEFILYVGDVNKNKDVQTLVKACIKEKLDLAIVGKQAANLEEIVNASGGPRDRIRDLLGRPHPETAHFSELKKLFKSKYIHVLGFVPNSDLNALWNAAKIYVQPSLYEGFGMGLVEALQAGVPCIASRTQALVEVAGSSCLFYEPANIKDLSHSIFELMRNSALRNKLKRAGQKRAKEYSWEKTAKQTTDLYKKLLC